MRGQGHGRLSVTVLVHRFADLLGLSFLSLHFRRFARMHFLYLIATNLSGVFISTFLLTSGADFSTVGVFYVLSFVFESCGYLIVGSLSRHMRTSVVTRLGLALYAASYLVLLLLREHTVLIIPLTALLASVGASFYWLPYHTYTINYTDPSNRQFGISYVGIVGNLIVLVTPPLSGFLVSALQGMRGYTVIFVVSLATFLCSAAVCRRLPSEPTRRAGNVVLSFFLRDFRDKRTLAVMSGFLVYGIRDGVFNYYLNLIVYDFAPAGGGTAVLGLNITGRALVCVGVFFLLSRRLSRRQSLIGMMGFSLSWPAVVCLLFVWYTPVSVFLFSIADIGVQAFVYNGMQVTSYDLCDQLSREAGSGSRRVEFIGVRNTVLCLGRIVGCLLFLLIPAARTFPVGGLFGLAVLAAPATLLIWWGERLLQDRAA